jgi:type III pantothenate kinase
MSQSYDPAVIVALDIGNTHVAYGFVRDGALAATGQAPTPRADVPNELEAILDEIIGRGAAETGDDVDLVVASVVPAVSAELRGLAARRRIGLLEATDATVPIAVSIESLATAGADRLVNAFAAARLHGTPAIVVDLGTATTFDVVDASGAFVGGAIAPGLGLGIDALATHTAQLPRVRIALPSRAIGRDTVEAIQSGAVLGHVGLVNYLVRAISAELAAPGDSRPKVVLTGGLSAHEWARAIDGVDAIDPLLTLRGLALLHTETAQLQPHPQPEPQTA